MWRYGFLLSVLTAACWSSRLSAAPSDLALTITDGPRSVIAGQKVSYLVTVSNLGPNAVTESLIIGLPDTLNLPSIYQWTILGANALEGRSPSRGQIRYVNGIVWDMTNFLVGESATLTVEVWFLKSGQFRMKPTLEVRNDLNLANNIAADYQIVVEPRGGILQFLVQEAAIPESRSHIDLPVNRSGGAIGTAQVRFATLDGTAIAGEDYVASAGALTFLNGEKQKVIRIQLLSNASVECARAFTIRLSDATNAFLGPFATTTVSIFDADVIPQGTTEYVSISHSNASHAAIGEELPSGLSADGRFVLFTSRASSVFPASQMDVYLRDTVLRTTQLISVNHLGTGPGDSDSHTAGISGDGRYVVFQSSASNLTTNSVTDMTDNVYVRDVLAQKTELISLSHAAPIGGNGYSHSPIISSNGAVIAFMSSATDLVPECPCAEGVQGFYAWDRTSRTIRLAASGTPFAFVEFLHGISADGRFLLYFTEGIPEDPDHIGGTYLHDRLFETNHLITMDGRARITPDGRFVAYDNAGDVFVYDVALGVTRLVSLNHAGTGPGNGFSYGSAITADGRFVAFTSEATDLLEQPLAAGANVFVRDLVNGATVLAIPNCHNLPAGSTEGEPDITSDGRYVVFTSAAKDLTSGDFRSPQEQPPFTHIFRRDLLHNITTLISGNYAYTGAGNDRSVRHLVSDDGRSIVFASKASDLAPTSDTDGDYDVFIWRELPPGVNADIRVLSSVASRGALMIVTLTVTNFGPDTAADVIATNSLTGPARFVTAFSTMGSCSIQDRSAICSVGTLSRRAGAKITLIAPPTSEGIAGNSARAFSGAPDPIELNNGASGSTALYLPPPAKLWITAVENKAFVQWLSTPPGFQLQSGLLRGWTTVTTDINDSGVIKTFVADEASPSMGFFRLAAP